MSRAEQRRRRQHRKHRKERERREKFARLSEEFDERSFLIHSYSVTTRPLTAEEYKDVNPEGDLAVAYDDLHGAIPTDPASVIPKLLELLERHPDSRM